jgi:hypothetical protein
VLGWPSSDQDALLRAARVIFKVNVTTMRRDLRAAVQAKIDHADA